LPLIAAAVLQNPESIPAVGQPGKLTVVTPTPTKPRFSSVARYVVL
jgi:hypothetical protein